MMRTLPALAALVCLGSGCTVSPDYKGTSFTCSEGVCPPGYSCVQEMCVGSEHFDAAPGDGASAVDAAPGADAAPAYLSCDETFSGAPGYVLCSEEVDRCNFNVETAGGNCLQACEALGSECLGAYDNNDPCTPVAASEDTCETNRNTEICICKRLAP